MGSISAMMAKNEEQDREDRRRSDEREKEERQRDKQERDQDRLDRVQERQIDLGRHPHRSSRPTGGKRT